MQHRAIHVHNDLDPCGQLAILAQQPAVDLRGAACVVTAEKDVPVLLLGEAGATEERALVEDFRVAITTAVLLIAWEESGELVALEELVPIGVGQKRSERDGRGNAKSL